MSILNRAGSLMLCAAVLTACADDPVGAEPRPGLGAQFAAITDRGTGLFVAEGVGGFPCLAEEIAIQVEVPFNFHVSVTPSGQIRYTDHFIHDAAVGTAVGVTSGTEWTLERLVSPFILHIGANELEHFTANQYWLSENGDRLQINALLHVSQNAQGEIKAEMDKVRCAVK